MMFSHSRTGTETATGAWIRTMEDNNSHPLPYLMWNVKACSMFHTTHLFQVSVPASVNRPLKAGGPAVISLIFVKLKLLSYLKIVRIFFRPSMAKLPPHLISVGCAPRWVSFPKSLFCLTLLYEKTSLTATTAEKCR